MTFTATQSSLVEDVSVFPRAEVFEEALEWIDRVAAEMSPGISISRIQRVLEDVLSLFAGQFPGYHACDTGYHDLAHTLRLVPPFCRIALGLAERHPGTISAHQAELGVIAVLLHDSGYLREENDTHGSGGKYTFRHIDRSVTFAGRYLPDLGYDSSDLACVEEMIRCTGVHVDPASLEYSTSGCRQLGYALGTADLLAQMSDPEYKEKLDHLFAEFQESYEYEGEGTLRRMKIIPFASRMDMAEKTPAFFENVVMTRFRAMDNCYRLLDDPQTGVNPYMEKIRENIAKILPK